MSDQQLQALKELGAKRSEERRRTPGASRRFLTAAGILTQKGTLKKSYGGTGQKKKA
jgi:hypothetical protein